MLIDSHCHLDHWEASEHGALLARAAEAGVQEMVTIGTRLAQSPQLIALARRPGTPKVWCTVGVHPEYAAEVPVPDATEIAEWARHPEVVGIGESGLDYFHETAPRDVQQESFRQHIRAARMAGLPLVIHARSADQDVGSILKQEWAGGPFHFVLHCFSSGLGLAEAALALGGYISFSGILTFPKSDENRAIALIVPADRLLVETDAPYLAPVPRRGKRNEPGYVAHTASALAGLRGLAPEGLAALTTANFRRLFARTA